MAHPLTQEHLTRINKALEAGSGAREIIARAKVAGIDVSEKERVLDEAEAKLKGIKQAFFPTGSR